MSTSENLDSFTFNPAGVGIDHGIETGYYFAPDVNGEISQNSTFYCATKSNGFGYSLKYNKGDKLFNATDVNNISVKSILEEYSKFINYVDSHLQVE